MPGGDDDSKATIEDDDRATIELTRGKSSPEDSVETELERPSPRDPPAKFSSSPLPIPERYKVKRRLGRGGMGDVLEAHDDHLGRDVAIKLLAPQHWPNRNIRERLLREGRAAAVLDHPSVVKVHDLDPNGRYIVMELVRGDSLAIRLVRRKRLDAHEVRSMGLALCDALAAAHAAGIVHRDIKPANILFDEKGRVRLADFGVASVIDSDLTATDAQIGTPAYMAPEQLRNASVDSRADIYSTGATLFEAATGIRLHGDKAVRDPRRVVIQHTGDRALANAIAHAVQEEPDERFQDITELSAALKHLGSRRGIAVALIAAAMLAIGGAVGVVVLSDDGDSAARSREEAQPAAVGPPAGERPSSPDLAPQHTPPVAPMHDPTERKQPEFDDPPEPAKATSSQAPEPKSAATKKKSRRNHDTSYRDWDDELEPEETESPEADSEAPEKRKPPVFKSWD